MKPPFIYVLFDSLEPNNYRYIGLTRTNPNRPYAHSRGAKSKNSNPTHTINWIRKLHSEGRDYSVLILEEFPFGCTYEELNDAERDYIKLARELGHELTNSTDGGDGGLGCKRTPEQIEKYRLLMLGNKHLLGYVFTPESRQKMSESHIGLTHSIKTKSKMSGSQKGRTKTSEHRTKLSISLQGNKCALGAVRSEESREKYRQATKAWWTTPDGIAKKIRLREQIIQRNKARKKVKL